MASAGTGYKLSLGADGPPGSYEDFDHADVFFVIGSNMADCHPILFLRMMDRVKAGAKLIVVDPRRTATADKADLFLQITPGTDLALLNGLLHLLVENGAHRRRLHRRAHRGLGRRCPPSSPTTRPTGSPRSPASRRPTSAAAAAMIGEAGEWMSCWTMGLNQSTHGTWNTNAICQPAPGHRRDLPPGQRPVLADRPAQRDGRPRDGLHGAGSARPAFGARRRRPRVRRGAVGPARRDAPRRRRAAAPIEMFERMAAGDIKACWIICTNPSPRVANRKTVIEGLEAAELVITQDVFADTETNAYADIVLPAALWAESDGVMVNSERNLTLLQAGRPTRRARPGPTGR